MAFTHMFVCVKIERSIVVVKAALLFPSPIGNSAIACVEVCVWKCADVPLLLFYIAYIYIQRV